MGSFRVRFARLAGWATAVTMALAPSVINPAVVQGFDPTKAPEIQDRLFSGFASFELLKPGSAPAEHVPSDRKPHGTQDCGGRIGSNVKVNQACLNVSDADLAGRGQAQNETSIAINPIDNNQLVASQNDYRRGDGNCYAAFSTDNGRTWNDSEPPMSFTRGNVSGVVSFGAARQYWQAGGDTSVAWDTKGNSYLSCQVFNRGAGVTSNPDVSSAFLVFRSYNHGASWNFPGRYVRASADVSGSGSQPFLDKQLLTVDNHVGSPFQDRLYVTWTEFTAEGTAYIYEASSADFGETFSAPHLVSGDAATLCGQTYGLPTPRGNCNENQFSQPFTGQDGALYVTWANFNNVVTGSDNRNQLLLARSTDGGNTFSTPIKVSDYYDLPDCLTYQSSDPFRACVPEKGSTQSSVFRATNYPSGAVDPTNASRVVVTFGSYINMHSNEANGCAPAGLSPTTGQDLYTGVKTPGACNNDILVSVSNNAGASFTGASADPRTLTSATSSRAQATSDQYWQWIAFTRDGKLVTSYYDRQYGTDETTGFSDISLSSTEAGLEFAVRRVTSSSMPPPTQFSGQFYGDYAGLAADNQAHPFWSDTRNPELFACGTPPTVCTASVTQGGQSLTANDEDVFTATVGVSSDR